MMHDTSQLLLFGGCQYPSPEHECSNAIHALNTSGDDGWKWRPVIADGAFQPFNRGEHTAVLLPAGSNKLLNKVCSLCTISLLAWDRHHSAQT